MSQSFVWQAKVKGLNARDGDIIQWGKTFKELMDKLADTTRDKYSQEIARYDLTMEIFFGELPQ